MSYDRDEVEAFMAAKEKKATPPTKRRAFLERADVRLTALTGDSTWNEYLSLVEAEVEAARSDRENYLHVLEHPFALDDLQMRAAKTGLVLCNERIRALEWAIGLPKSIHDEVEEYAKLGPISKSNGVDRAESPSHGDS